MQVIIYSSKRVSPTEFIHFWGNQYHYPQESLYTQNIGKPLTADRLRSLFLWKNGMRLSDRKRQSLETNYIKRLTELTALRIVTHSPSTLSGLKILVSFLFDPALTGSPNKYPLFVFGSRIATSP
jgi:hypothetical protein